MDLNIRNAEKEDLPAVLQLIKELAVYEKEPDAVEVTLSELEEAGFGENPQFKCFVGEVDGKIVGMALVYFRFSTWKGNTVHLEDLIVTQDMRGMGVGEALYKRVLEYAINEGVKRVNWVVLDWNKGAIKFYERSGANVLSNWWQVEMEADAIKKYLEKEL